MKISVTKIIKDHYGSLYLANSNNLDSVSLAIFVGVPILAAVGVVVADPAVRDVSSLLTAVAVLGGFLFAGLILVLEVGLHLGREAASAVDGRKDQRLAGRIEVVGEVRANVAYSTVVAIAGTAFFAISDVVRTTGQSLPLWYVAIGTAILAHLLLTMLMVITRLYSVLGDEATDSAHRRPPAEVRDLRTVNGDGSD